MSTRPDAPPPPAPRRDDRTFLGRWSARKRGTEAAASTEGRADPADVAGTDAADTGAPDAIPGTDPLAASLGTSGAALAPVPDAIGATARATGVPADAGAEPGRGAVADTDVASAGADTGADELVPTDADMPPIDTLNADSDLSAFFSKGVSAGLRRAALRHVFRQPAFNVRDGLNDYDGDYTKFEPLGDTVTADMKFHAARLERKRLEEERERLEAEREALEREHLALEREAAEREADEGALVDDENERDATGADAAGSSHVDADGEDDGNGTTVAGTGERRADGTGAVERRIGTDAANDVARAVPRADTGGTDGREESVASAAGHHASNDVPDDIPDEVSASDGTSRRDRDGSTAHG